MRRAGAHLPPGGGVRPPRDPEEPQVRPARPGPATWRICRRECALDRITETWGGSDDGIPVGLGSLASLPLTRRMALSEVLQLPERQLPHLTGEKRLGGEN